MPYDANDASRARLAQQQHQRMVKRWHAQSAKQMDDLMARSRAQARTRRPADTYPGDDQPAGIQQDPLRARRALRRLAVLAGVVALVAVAFGVWQSSGGASGGGGSDSAEIQATVRPGTTWNLRSGPSTSDPIIGSVTGGQTVVVRCVHGSWASLATPRPDAFVAMAGLSVTSVPTACGSGRTQP